MSSTAAGNPAAPEAAGEAGQGGGDTEPAEAEPDQPGQAYVAEGQTAGAEEMQYEKRC